MVRLARLLLMSFLYALTIGVLLEHGNASARGTMPGGTSSLSTFLTRLASIEAELTAALLDGDVRWGNASTWYFTLDALGVRLGVGAGLLSFVWGFSAWYRWVES